MWRVALMLVVAIAAAADIARSIPAPRPGQPTSAHHAGSYETWTLANGLKVYAVRDPSTANVAVQVWYRVGGRDDPPGRSGFAHLFEHLMFKGARDLPPEYMDRLTEDVGGYNNASTDQDFTEYHEVVPAGRLQAVLWAEAQRMGSLDVDPANFASERAVVEQELRQTVQADPYSRLFEWDIPGAAHGQGAYGRSPIGSVADLEAASLADVRAFHARFYRPDNAVLVVVGAFDPATLKAWTQQYFGPVPRPAAPLPVRSDAAGPPSRGPRVVDRPAPDAALPAIALAFPGPAAASPDAAALQVLDAALTTGRSARLKRDLVEGWRLANDVFSDVELDADGGTIDVGLVLAPGHGLRQGAAALNAGLARLRRDGITADELAAAKNQLLASRLQDRETPDGLASDLGEAAMLQGDARAADANLAAIGAVTAADVQRVARTWLAPGRQVMVRYHATGATLGDGADAAMAGGLSRRRPDPASPGSPLTQTRAPRGLPPPGVTPAVALPATSRRVLANGLQVIVARTTRLPLATAILSVRGGSGADPRDAPGLTALAAALAAQGASGRSGLQMATATERLGAQLAVQTDEDTTRIGVSGLSLALERGLPILADIARRPDFAAPTLRRLRGQTAQAARLALDDADAVSDAALSGVVMGEGGGGRRGGRGSGHAGAGPLAMLAATRPEIARQYRRLFRPDEAVLVIAGNVDAEAVFRMAERDFGGWTNPPLPKLHPAGPGKGMGGRTVVIDLPGAEDATVVMAARAPGRGDPAFASFQVANAILGGGYASRLNAEIRVRRGLTYDVTSSLEPHGPAALFSASAETDARSAATVAALMLAQLRDLAARPSPAAELAARKAALVGSFRRDIETTAGFADFLADQAIHDVDLRTALRYPDTVAAVTAAQAQRAAALLARPAGLDLLVLGDARRLAPAVRGRFGRTVTVSAQSLRDGL